MYKIIFFIIVFLTFSCSNGDKKEPIKKELKKEIKKIPKDRELKKQNKYEVKQIKDLNIELEIPGDFKSKDNIFFMNNGINISFDKDKINDDFSLHKYSNKVFKDIKKDNSDIILDEEKVIINSKKALLLKYILDRKKYFVIIKSVLIQNKNNIIIVNITGKKKDMENYEEMIDNILSSVVLF